MKESVATLINQNEFFVKMVLVFFLSMKNSETLFNQLKFCCELALRGLSEFIYYFTYRKRSCLSLSLFRITSKKKTMNAEISALVIEVPTPITI